MPFLAATVAAPIQKLWLEKLPWIPAADKMPCNHEVSKARDIIMGLRHLPSGPNMPAGRKWRKVETPPCQYAENSSCEKDHSVFEALMRRCKHEGDE